MKILTILGTRPEIIRLSLIIEKLDRLCTHILVHTGQNFDPRLNDIFFNELNIRSPDYFMGVIADTVGKQIGNILIKSEEVILKEKPDRLLILGDTNSALSAIVAKRHGLPVYHMEAGNRCYDDRVPEEVNRRIIDHSSDVLMPYTDRSRQNLIREGITPEHVYVIGNPIYEVIKRNKSKIDQSEILNQLGIEARKYFLVTVHRAENVDVQDRLISILNSLMHIQKEFQFPVIISTHPRTKSQIENINFSHLNTQVRFMEPFGFFDFVHLEENSYCVLSDSGTVQEECAILQVPNVTIRDVTERPETVECGSNILSGIHTNSIIRCVNIAVNNRDKWLAPREYLQDNVSDTVIKLLLGYRHKW